MCHRSHKVTKIMFLPFAGHPGSTLENTTGAGPCWAQCSIQSSQATDNYQCQQPCFCAFSREVAFMISFQTFFFQIFKCKKFFLNWCRFCACLKSLSWLFFIFFFKFNNFFRLDITYLAQKQSRSPNTKNTERCLVDSKHLSRLSHTLQTSWVSFNMWKSIHFWKIFWLFRSVQSKLKSVVCELNETHLNSFIIM